MCQSLQEPRLLSQSLDDLGTTLGECLERTRWSSSLDCTTYLYYFYKWLYTTSSWSHVLSRMFYNHMTCHMIWLHKFPCYLYLVFVEWLDICNQVFERAGNFLLLRALITWPPLQDSLSQGIFLSVLIFVPSLLSFPFISFSPPSV